MAIFRVGKTKDFTVMSNHHLRNAELPLKAKGLISLMLSLPEDWKYTTKGLAHDAAGYATPQGLRHVLFISATPYQWKHIIGQRV